MRTVCIKIPESLLQTIDELVKELGFTNRSELIRYALRALLKEKIREVFEEIQRGDRTTKRSPRKKSVMIEEIDLEVD